MLIVPQIRNGNFLPRRDTECLVSHYHISFSHQLGQEQTRRAAKASVKCPAGRRYDRVSRGLLGAEVRADKFPPVLQTKRGFVEKASCI